MPHAIRSQMAELFNLPLARVRVIVETLGGGFGSKGSLRLEPITSFLALKANRPVKIVLKREEEFVTVCKHPATIHIKTGATKDGILLARQVNANFNTGAYSDIGPVVARNGGSAMSGPSEFHMWGSIPAPYGPIWFRRALSAVSACPRRSGHTRARWTSWP